VSATAGSNTQQAQPAQRIHLPVLGVAEVTKGGESQMTFSDVFQLIRAHWRKEEGQTMAEYGVVLAVITVGAVLAFTALSGGISGAINRVITFLPK
jgi:Flp pilus assembly pilin Flp